MSENKINNKYYGKLFLTLFHFEIKNYFFQFSRKKKGKTRFNIYEK